MPKVSVIIPVYGVEKYIERCARSLFEQTLDDIEYIFVDDCTPDDSISLLKRILDEYPDRQSQARIEKMPVNSGQAAVRKYGTLLATGDYVVHCDSDDYLDDRMYDVMYEKASETDADIVIVGYYKVFESGLKTIIIPDAKDNGELMSRLLDTSIKGTLWNKLVRRTLYDASFVWPIHDIIEDLVCTIQLVMKAHLISYIHQPYYYYIQRQDSILHRRDIESMLKRLDDVKNNVELISKCCQKEFFSKEIIKLKWRMRVFLLPYIDNAEIWRMYKNFYPGLDWQILIHSDIRTFHKIKTLLCGSGLFHSIISVLIKLKRLKKKNKN